jgi:hypothetical protein
MSGTDIRELHRNYFLAVILLKTVERAQLNFRHRFWSNIVQVSKIRPMVGFFCAGLGEIRPVWKNFGQLGRYSTKIDGGNSTARVRPVSNEFRPKTIYCVDEYFVHIPQIIFSSRADDTLSMLADYHPQWLIIIPSNQPSWMISVPLE